MLNFVILGPNAALVSQTAERVGNAHANAVDPMD